MSGSSSRRKGMTYENEVYKKLLEWAIERSEDTEVYKQNRSGYDGDDLLIKHRRSADANPVSVSMECKNQKEMRLSSWIDQAVANAKQDQVPLVVHKRRGVADVSEHYVTMRMKDFLQLLE